MNTGKELEEVMIGKKDKKYDKIKIKDKPH